MRIEKKKFTILTKCYKNKMVENVHVTCKTPAYSHATKSTISVVIISINKG